MPAYEYFCDDCAARFEKRQKMSDAALESCPSCGGHVRRIISGGAGAITRGTASVHSEIPPCANGGACCGGACPRNAFSEN